MAEPRLSRPPMVTPWGKCDAAIKTMVPEEVLDRLQERAKHAGVGLSEVVRNVLLRDVFGDAQVESFLIDQFRSTVRTGTGKPEVPSCP